MFSKSSLSHVRKAKRMASFLSIFVLIIQSQYEWRSFFVVTVWYQHIRWVRRFPNRCIKYLLSPPSWMWCEGWITLMPVLALPSVLKFNGSGGGYDSTTRMCVKKGLWVFAMPYTPMWMGSREMNRFRYGVCMSLTIVLWGHLNAYCFTCII